jgi:hypothetical protein
MRLSRIIRCDNERLDAAKYILNFSTFSHRQEADEENYQESHPNPDSGDWFKAECPLQGFLGMVE